MSDIEFKLTKNIEEAAGFMEGEVDNTIEVLVSSHNSDPKNILVKIGEYCLYPEQLNDITALVERAKKMLSVY